MQDYGEDWEDTAVGKEKEKATPIVSTSFEQSLPLQVHQLALPLQNIIFVDDDWGLTECLARITKVVRYSSFFHHK